MEGLSKLEQIKALANTKAANCIQCGRCSAACPVGDKMDLLPNRMVWELAQGGEEALLKALSPWKCLSCMACVARCPRGVAPGAIMEAVRLVQLRSQGGDRLTPDMVANFDPALPQQALVAAFRKYRK